MLKVLKGVEDPARGRGVFWMGLVNANPHQMLHEADLLFIPILQVAHLDKTILKNYYFKWDDEFVVLSMGLGSFFNHSYKPNVYYDRYYDQETIIFRALREIQWGEELLINYNGDIEDKTPVPFDVK